MAEKNYQKPKNTKATILRTLSYVTSRRLLFLLVLVLIVVAALTNVAGTYLMRPIINSITNAAKAGQADLPGLGLSILRLLAVYIAAAAATYGQAALAAQLAQRGCNRLRRDLFEKLQDLPLSYFDRHTHGELMSRFTNDADNVQMALEQSVVSLFSSALTFVGTIVMMIYLSPLLFLITILTLGVTLAVFKVMGSRSRKYYQKQQAALGTMNGNIQEMIEGLKVVKAFTHEEQAKAEFAALNEEYRVAASNANFYSSAVMPMASNITNIGYAVTAAAGGLLAIAAGFDLGGLTSFLTYTRQVSQPVNQISMQLTNILSALAGAERIFEVMDAQPEEDQGKVTLVPVEKGADSSFTQLPDGSHAHAWAWKQPLENGDFRLVELKGDVRLNHVDFSYVPGKQILKDVSVYAKPGQKIAFVGSTGAGKTTITNLINRFYEIENGVITYDGIDVKDIEKDSLRLSLGAVLQDTHLFTGTVMENIRYGNLDATDEECIAAAKSANAHSFIRRLPEGYQTMVTGDGANLSQGQRQLLAIARAAVKDPPVMVLDEATSSIDTRTEQLISQGMDTLMKDRTVFVIAHRLSTVRNANAIAVIEDGQIIEKGSHEELLEQKGRYYKLYTGQFQLT